MGSIAWKIKVGSVIINEVGTRVLKKLNDLEKPGEAPP